MSLHWSDGNLHALEQYHQSQERPEPTDEHRRDAFTKVVEAHLTDSFRQQWAAEMLGERPEVAESVVQSAAIDDDYADDAQLGRQIRHAMKAYMVEMFEQEITDKAEELAA